MNPQYAIADTSALFSPGLVFYKDLIRHNISEAVRIAGSTGRLRPHVKTHKTREIVRMQMEAGIKKHKCATLAEAEMLAQCDVPDIFLAYNMVGPNCGRLTKLMKAYPKSRFSVTVDHPAGAKALSAGHHPQNLASKKVLEKLGFRYTHDEFFAALGIKIPYYLVTQTRHTFKNSGAEEGVPI